MSISTWTHTLLTNDTIGKLSLGTPEQYKHAHVFYFIQKIGLLQINVKGVQSTILEKKEGHHLHSW